MRETTGHLNAVIKGKGEGKYLMKTRASEVLRRPVPAQMEQQHPSQQTEDNIIPW